MAGGVLGVEELGEVARGKVGGGGDARGAVEIADGVGGIEGDALVFCGEKARGPIGGAGGRDATDVGDGDVGGEIVVFAAESVAEPGTGGREAFKNEAGIHGDAGGAMSVGARAHRMDEGHVVDVARKVGKFGGNGLAGLAGGLKIPGAAHEVAVGALEGDVFVAAGHGLAAALFKLGFVVEGIEVGCAAGAENLDDALGLGGEVGLTGGSRE